MQSSRSYIKDSGDFIKKTKSLSTIPKDSILVTADVVGYILVFLMKQDLKYQRKLFIIVLIKKFQQKIWLKRLNLFLRTTLSNLTVKSLVWHGNKTFGMVSIYRLCVFYLGSWTRKLDSFLEELNRCNSNLKFTYVLSKKSIPFLDLKVSLSNQDLSTDLHIKSTDRHQFLHYTSSHPDRTKRSIFQSQALRINRICSNKSDFLKHFESMKSWFEVRGCLNKLIELEMEKVKFFKNGNVVQQRDARKGVPFVLTYHPSFKSMGEIINKNLNLPYMDNKVKKAFTPKPMISFHSDETCMQQHLYEEFCSSNHNCFISDVSVTFIDKADPFDPLKREDHWRSTLKTMARFGLNIEEIV